MLKFEKIAKKIQNPPKYEKNHTPITKITEWFSIRKSMIIILHDKKCQRRKIM